MQRAYKRRLFDRLPIILFLLQGRSSLATSPLECPERPSSHHVVVVLRLIIPFIFYHFVIRVLKQVVRVITQTSGESSPTHLEPVALSPSKYLASTHSNNSKIPPFIKGALRPERRCG
jgi:hypothetical protein